MIYGDIDMVGDVNIQSPLRATAELEIICTRDKKIIFLRDNDMVKMFVQRKDADDDWEYEVSCLFPVSSLQAAVEILTSFEGEA